MGRKKRSSTAHLPGGQRITPADVAARAGVAVNTVQRAFNWPERVAKDTREKILRIAQEIGYHPNVTGRALSTGRVATTALVLLSHRLHDAFVADTFAGFSEVMSQRGIEILVSIIPPAIRPEAWMRKLVSSGRCDSIAVHLEIVTQATLEEMKSLHIPLTILYSSFNGVGEPYGISAVGFDNDSGIRQAVSHLHSLGHRRIAYFGGTPGWPDTKGREDGYRGAMLDAHLPIDNRWVIACDFSKPEESASSAFSHLYSLAGPKPTAIVCASDELARGTMNAARRWGKSVPADISVTGFDNGTWTPYHNPPLTTVRFPEKQIGVAAAETILEHYANLQARGRTVILPTELVIRESTAPPPKTEV